jgi:F-type H+-transporting ATPase subunit delta
VATEDQKVTGVAGRYAAAVFELAREQKAQASVGEDFARFQQMLAGSEDLQRLVRSPVFSAADQIAALNALFAAGGIKGLAAKFIGLIASNRRLYLVADMIRAYQALEAAERGEVSAEAVSAVALTPAQITKIKAQLKAATGQEVALSTRTDESILGGLIVKVGSRMIDSSLRTKLQNLKVAMKGVA